jgi:hypothetical protein
MTRQLVLLASLLILSPVAGYGSGRYDPRLQFRTISTPRFDVHFHQGEEAEARRLAAIAETVAAQLDSTLGRPSGRVQIVLVDQSDLSNGWATPLPYNTIEITAAAPAGQNLIGNTSDWLRLVFSHEYTHIVHLSRGAGWIGGLRRVFGRMPLLYPNVYLPRWQIEGIAVYEESALTGQGRIPAGDFRTILDVASAVERFEPLDRAGGGLVNWPAGHVPYVYGGYFHQFLVERYGEASMQRLTDATAGRLPYFGSPAYKKVFKRSLGELWQDFEDASRQVVQTPGSATTRLTQHGFDVWGPRFTPEGRLYYSVANPHGFPSLMTLGPDDAQPQKVANRFLGNSVGMTGSVLVFDQIEVTRQVGLQSDLYAIATDSGKSWRLTNGARTGDPDVSPDGQTVVCTIQRADRRDLATMALSSDRRHAGSLNTLISEAHMNFASPRWSPDGRWIAAELGPSQIVLIDPVAKRIVRPIAKSPRGRSVTPAWMADGSLVFASDREGGAFRIYRTNLETHETWRLEGTGTDARWPALSLDGRVLVFVGYTPDGYDLFRMPLDTARWTILRDDVSTDAPSSGARQIAAREVSTALPERTYSPRRSLTPRFWTPTFESDGDEFVVGAATGGIDALGRHAYGVEAGWTAGRARPDWQVAYAYDRWWPTLFANVSDDTDPWRDGEVRTTEANTGVLLPFRRVRWSQSVLGALHASTDLYNCSTCGVDGETRVARRSVRSGWILKAARAYGYSISLEEGWSASITTEFVREALGSSGDSSAATVDLRGYVPVVPRHGVLAARVAGATAWGDDSTRRAFSASGSGPRPLQFDFGSDAVGLVRGLEEGEVSGRHAAVVNIDYRFPLMRLERGAGTLPIFARTISGALFVDAGHAWDTTFRRQAVRASLGAELSLDAVVGYVLPLTFTTGAAWVSHDRGLVAFGRIGHAF